MLIKFRILFLICALICWGNLARLSPPATTYPPCITKVKQTISSPRASTLPVDASWILLTICMLLSRTMQPIIRSNAFFCILRFSTGRLRQGSRKAFMQFFGLLHSRNRFLNCSVYPRVSVQECRRVHIVCVCVCPFGVACGKCIGFFGVLSHGRPPGSRHC